MICLVLLISLYKQLCSWYQKFIKLKPGEFLLAKSYLKLFNAFRIDVFEDVFNYSQIPIISPARLTIFEDFPMCGSLQIYRSYADIVSQTL